jgi:DNA repair protein RadC
MRTNPDMDIVAYMLEAVLKAKPDDSFCKSIQMQYIERGGLSKKQLEGLQGKAQRIEGIHPGKLATLEAIIKKKHVTQRSTATITKVEEQKDEAAEKMINDILEKYPEHKRVLLFKSKFLKDGKLVIAEKEELEKFHKLLMK